MQNKTNIKSDVVNMVKNVQLKEHQPAFNKLVQNKMTRP